MSAKEQRPNAGGLARIKSDTNMFVMKENALFHRKTYKEDSEDECESDLSVGDANYPVVGFHKRSVKDFTPKQMIQSLNMS